MTKGPRGGWGVKLGENLIHVVVECPLSVLSPVRYLFKVKKINTYYLHAEFMNIGCRSICYLLEGERSFALYVSRVVKYNKKSFQ